jgi:hypothetical protein
MMQSLWGSFRVTRYFNIQADKRERNYLQRLPFVEENVAEYKERSAVLSFGRR